MKILGLDPGTTRIGFGLVFEEHQKLHHAEHGVWEAPSNTAQPERLCQLYTRLTQYLKLKKPDVVAVERLFFGRATTQMLNIVEARGVILLACGQANIPTYSYAPQTIKAAVARGDSPKKIIQQQVARYFELATLPKPDDAADALAAAICHYQHGSQLTLL